LGVSIFTASQDSGLAGVTNEIMSETKTVRPTWKPAGKVGASEEPFKYHFDREFVEPDWRRLPGYNDVTASEWETALWQRRHTVKNLKELKAVFGNFLPSSVVADSMADPVAGELLFRPYFLGISLPATILR
jgi:hypothetical protein